MSNWLYGDISSRWYNDYYSCQMVCLAVKFYILPQATVLTACNLALEGLLIIIIIISCFKKYQSGVVPYLLS